MKRSNDTKRSNKEMLQYLQCGDCLVFWDSTIDRLREDGSLRGVELFCMNYGTELIILKSSSHDTYLHEKELMKKYLRFSFMADDMDRLVQDMFDSRKKKD